jgi:cation diffusion facilitator family transporter
MKNEKSLVAFVSVVAAVFLTGFKIAIGFITGSLGILSEALHSALDLVAAVITLLAVRLSGKPCDLDHHYGHGKIENLSALAETLLLLFTCFWIMYESVNRISSGHGLHLTNMEAGAGMLVVITSIIVDMWRARKLSAAAKKYKSQALEADAVHFSTDVWSSTVVLIGLVCVKLYEWTNFPIFFYADSFAALIVAIIVLQVCWKLSRSAIDSLLDRAPDKESEEVDRIIKGFPSILSHHDLRVRTSGASLFVEVAVHVDPNLSLMEAHNISEQLEQEIIRYNEMSTVSIHVEPNTA